MLIFILYFNARLITVFSSGWALHLEFFVVTKFVNTIKSSILTIKQTISNIYTAFHSSLVYCQRREDTS